MKFFRQNSLHRSPLRAACCAGLAAALLLPAARAATAQPSNAVAIKNEKILQKHYEAAQKDQVAHHMRAAAQQFRIFLADALGELAIAEAHGNEYKQASANFDDALSLAPNSPALLVEYSELALRTGRLAKAEKLAQKIIHNYPTNKNATAHAYATLGQALLKEGKNKDARKALQKAVSLNPDFVNGYNLAVVCLDLEDQKCAAKLFGEMRSGYGDKAILHMYFGQAYMASDFQSKAVAEFKQAIAKDNKLPGAHYSLAAAYLVAGKHVAEAEAQLRQAIALHPREGMAYAALGHLEANQQEYAAAEKDLLAATRLAPKDPDGFLYLGQLYAATNKNAKAEKALEQSIALTKDITRNHEQVQKAHYLLGRLLLKSGKRAEAQKQLQIAQLLMNKNLSRARQKLADFYNQGSGSSAGSNQPAARTARMETMASEQAAQAAASFAQRMAPLIANSYNSLGAIAGMAGDQEASFEDFKHAKRWQPDMPGLNENLGRAAYASLHFADAVAPLTTYVKAHPGDKTLRAALGVSLYMTDQYGKAQAVLQPEMKDSKISDELNFIYAECLVKTGKGQEGIARLKALVAKLPKEESLRRSLGEAYAADGNARQAMKELRVAEKLDAKDPLVHKDLAAAYTKSGKAKDAARELQQYHSLTARSGGSKTK